MSLVLGVPPQVLRLVQEGLLERSFHDGLFPALMYRGEAQEETSLSPPAAMTRASGEE